MATTMWSRALLWQYVRALCKHWYWVVGSGLLTIWDLIERANADWYTFPRWVRLITALICLLIAQFLAYAEIATSNKALETEIADMQDGIAVNLTGLEAYEHLNWNDSIYENASHWVYVKFALTIRNRSGREPTAVELVACDTNIQHATLSQLLFLGDPDSPIESPVSISRRIPEGDIRRVIVRAQFSLPMSEVHTLTNGISGVLKLADNRINPISVSFSTNVIASSIGEAH
jgi:hypothetical protein